MRSRVRPPVLVLLGLAAACVSAEKRFEQATRDEAEGRWESAAEKYVDALRRDPEYPGARERALAAGNRAIAGRLEVATGLEGAGSFERAVDEYRAIDGLVERAAAVRVVLEVPPDYRTRRESAFVQAAQQALASAGAAAAAGRHEEAAQAYRAARSRYPLSDAQRERSLAGEYAALVAGAEAATQASRFDDADALLQRALAVFGPDSPRSAEALSARERVTEARYRSLLGEAHAYMDQGRFQEAYRVTEVALGIYGPEAPQSAEAHELARTIVEAGTLRLAATPVGNAETLVGVVPESLRRAIDDRLEEDHWNRPPLFVAVIEPASVRNRLRLLLFDDPVLSDRRACVLGEDVGAGFVAVLFVDEYEAGSAGPVERRRAKLEAGGEVEFDVHPRRTLAVRCSWRLVSVADRRVLADGHADANVTRDCAHAVYLGDPDRLLLTREQHGWFDPRRRHDADRALEAEAAERISAQVCDAVCAQVLLRLR